MIKEKRENGKLHNQKAYGNKTNKSTRHSDTRRGHGGGLLCSVQKDLKNEK